MEVLPIGRPPLVSPRCHTQDTILFSLSSNTHAHFTRSVQLFSSQPHGQLTLSHQIPQYFWPPPFSNRVLKGPRCMSPYRVNPYYSPKHSRRVVGLQSAGDAVACRCRPCFDSRIPTGRWKIGDNLWSDPFLAGMILG